MGWSCRFGEVCWRPLHDGRQCGPSWRAKRMSQCRRSRQNSQRWSRPSPTRIVFCLDPVTLESAGSSTAAAERGEEVRPRPKGSPRASSVEAPITDAREVERVAHRVEQYSLHMAGLFRRGVLEPSMVYAFFMTKGGQQVPQPKSKAKARARSREMMKEGVEQTPDVSPLVYSLRGRPQCF